MRKILVGLSAIVLVACTSPLAENGPKLCPTEGFKFTVSDLDIKKVIPNGNNFTESEFTLGTELNLDDNEGLHLVANFNEVVEWELTISSATSSNKKVYASKSNKIDIYWYGNTDVYPFFADENCKLTLRFPCKDVTEGTFSLKGKANFTKTHPNFGILLRDFDGNGMYPEKSGTAVNDVNNGWFDANVTFSYETQNASPMGNRYLRMFRQASNPTWYLGAHSFPVNTTDKKFEDMFPTTNTDSIFLNFFIRADKHPNANMEIGLRNPGTGLHLASGAINFQGWKLVSRSFSNLKITNGARSGLAMPAADIFKINDMILQLGASPQQTNILEYDYDFIFISFGSPLAN
jgi:hypothetical protein